MAASKSTKDTTKTTKAATDKSVASNNDTTPNQAVESEEVVPAKAESKKATKSAKTADAPESSTEQSASDVKAGRKEKSSDTPIKTNTKASVKYDPDFTRSVLDASQAKNEPMVQTNRYTDSELAEFRELIHRKLESAKKELAYLQGVITRKDETGGDNDARYMTMEDGSLSMEREQLSQMASRQITYIDHLEKALIRIENKTYGICRVTGKLIDKARLRVVPHATLSVEAKMGKVKS